MSQLLIPNLGPTLVPVTQMRMVQVERSEVAKNLELEYDYQRETYYVEARDVGKAPYEHRFSLVDAITKFLF